jgi:hypothetical protein
MEVPKTNIPTEHPFSYLYNPQTDTKDAVEKFMKSLPVIIEAVREEFKDINTVLGIMEQVLCRLKQTEIIEGTSPRVFPTKVEVQYSMETTESMLQKKFPQLYS